MIKTKAMKTLKLDHLTVVQSKLRQSHRDLRRAVSRYWFQAALFSIAGYGIGSRELSVNLHVNDRNSPIVEIQSLAPKGEAIKASYVSESIHPMNVSMLSFSTDGASQADRPSVATPPPKSGSSKAAAVTRTNSLGELANEFKNVSFPDQDEVFESADKRQSKRQKQLAYVQRFADIAKAEQTKFGIPASITLAQGLLESDAGESPLSEQANNHFGIKCFSRTCGRGHCRNFTDDSHKDFFRVFPSAWESFRSHSMLLQSSRYRPLKKLGNENYTDWAVGLSKAGYATDKKYAQKLIHLIEDLDLFQYD
jgi:flagellum-specific peptidoglycan hydrolase FlgJ